MKHMFRYKVDKAVITHGRTLHPILKHELLIQKKVDKAVPTHVTLHYLIEQNFIVVHTYG